MAQNTSLSSKFKPRKELLTWLAALALTLIGLFIRLTDLTDPPLDFHPTRQLRGAIIARGIYFSRLPDADPKTREMAINFGMSTGQFEPPILETLVAYTYLITGGENPWIARIYNSLFWIIGGITLFALSRRMTSPGAALVVLEYYLLLPFGAQASRSFQPDPGMTMWIVLAVYTLYRWAQKQEWKWAVLTGVLAGVAILTKAIAVYIIAGAAITVVLNTLGLRRFWKQPQVWAMGLLMAAPSGVYYLFQHSGRASEYFSNWTLALSHLILEPHFYVRWLSFIQNLMGFSILLLALFGVMLSLPHNKALLLGLWGGYLVYGLTLPYQMYTHSYYHIQLIPILALSLAPIAQIILDRLTQQPKVWQALSVGLILVGILYPSWVSIVTLAGEDHRHEPAYWQKIGSLLPTDGKILALTQDYGYPLMYYGWRKVSLWQNAGEQGLAELRDREKEFEASFTNRIEGKDYFLVTAFNQFEKQPDLQKILYENYPILEDEKGYLIFDLAHPLSP